MAIEEQTKVLEELKTLCQKTYGRRLVSLAIFGSLGRDTARPDSDIDILLVVNDLSTRRMVRIQEFLPIEARLPGILLSPVFKTPQEIKSGSWLLLDMVEDAVILFDRGNFLKGTLDSLRQNLKKLGAKRIWSGNAWYWDLKPNYQPGEVFELE